MTSVPHSQDSGDGFGRPPVFGVPSGPEQLAALLGGGDRGAERMPVIPPHPGPERKAP